MSLVPTTKLGPFPLGMDNRVPDYKMALPDEAGHLLRDALNVAGARRPSSPRRAAFRSHRHLLCAAIPSSQFSR